MQLIENALWLTVDQLKNEIHENWYSRNIYDTTYITHMRTVIYRYSLIYDCILQILT